MTLLQFTHSTSYFFSRQALFIACRLLALCVLAVAASNCGGGSGSAVPGASPWKAGVFKGSNNFVNRCAEPRAGINPATNAAFLDRKGTVLDENNFLRSWNNETYLWYREIVDVNPALDSVPTEYFQKLKTTAKTSSGKDKDIFHFTYPTTVWNDVVQGVDTGYGVTWAWISSSPPRNVVVSYTEPGFSAATQNLQRGAKIISIDGADFVNGDQVDILNAGLFPDAHGEQHVFEILDYGSSTTRSVVLTSGTVTKTEVQNVKTIDTPTGKVGYFLFNDHLGNAEQGLIGAVTQLRDASITDLVVDVRYNGGGYLYLASELSFMIAGKNATDNKIFEKTEYNDKHKTLGLSGELLSPEPFYDTSSDNIPLPELNLPRVFIITSGDTCSASESIINGLRGVNVEVIQIGSKTCGKPYGFYPQDNCSTTYFTVQFKGTNNKGYGEYSDGFVPSAVDNGEDNIKGCTLGDDFTHFLGDPEEANMAAVLQYRKTSTCVAPLANNSFKLQKPSGEDLSNIQATTNKAAGLTNRFIQNR